MDSNTKINIEILNDRLSFVINKLNHEKLKYNIIDEQNKLRIELFINEHIYYTEFTVSDVIKVPASKNSGWFSKLYGNHAFSDWIEKQAKDMRLEEKYHEIARNFIKTFTSRKISLDELIAKKRDLLSDDEMKLAQSILSLLQ